MAKAESVVERKAEKREGRRKRTAQERYETENDGVRLWRRRGATR
jgi:hypothetical protein